MTAEATLAAAVDTLIPADDWPGGWEGGTAALLVHEAQIMADVVARVAPLCLALDDEVATRRATAFSALSPDDRVAVLSQVTTDPAHGAGAAALLQLAFQGFYAGARHGEPVGLQMIGFRGVPEGVDVVEPEEWRSVGPDELAAEFDVVVVGGGAGGGVAAGVLAEGGMRVLLLERASMHTNAALRGDHFRGKRPGLAQPTASPGPGHPRVLVGADGTVDEVESVEHSRWGLNAMTLGGGTRVWQGMAWRFMPEDFAMASTYGVPEGSSLCDWPFDYAELAPYYDRAEWEIGVSGEEGPLTTRTPRARGYPMPALPGGRLREMFGAAADRLGWGWGPIPFCINSTPRSGRAACVGCAQCVGHACPVDAKNGTQNTVIRRALASGSASLAMGAQVVEVLHDRGRRATGVRVVFHQAGTPVERTVRCGDVVVAAGAVETPRLLQVSGLGNAQVGRHLHDHSGTVVVGGGPEAIERYIGPGHCVATMDFVHRDGEAWGGGIVFDGLPFVPVVLASLAPIFGVPPAGSEHKRWMREGLPCVLGAMGIGQQVPSARSSVSADPTVRDRVGMPVARLEGHPHPVNREVVTYLEARCSQWLAEIGCQEVRPLFDAMRSQFGGGRDAGPQSPAGEHSAGTCRMGDDPATSATDRFGRLHGTDNVYVADASLHPTNGSVNPGLTVMANAFRVAELLLEERSARMICAPTGRGGP